MLLVRKLHSPKTKSNQWFTVMFVWQPNIPLSHMLNKSLWQKNVLKIFNGIGNRLVVMVSNNDPISLVAGTPAAATDIHEVW